MDKAEVKQFVADIEKMIASRSGADIASLVALNTLMRQPNASELFDDELKSSVRDLWASLKSYGIELDNPPLLFGLPEGFGEDDSEEIEQALEVAAAHIAEEIKNTQSVVPPVEEAKEQSKETPQA